jgi:hypothetical protein
MKTLKQIREASGGKEAYMKFFNSLLKKFGVDSPSELSGDKKKKFFNAVDKGWESDSPDDANEVTIHLSNKLTEKVKGGRGKASLDIDFEGDKKDAKFMATKYKIKIKLTRMGADISGDKQKILAFLQGKDYGMDDADIEDLFPELLENKDDFKDDTDVSDYEGNYSGVEEAHNGHVDDESPKKKVDDDEGNYSGVDEMTVDVDYDDNEVNKRKHMQLMKKHKVKVTKSVWDHGTYRAKVTGNEKNIRAWMKGQYDQDYIDDTFESVNEKAPPGMEGVVKKLKQDHSDEEAFAIAWSIHNKKNEAVKILKPIKGKLGKTYPVMNMSQKKKIIAIAKKHSGNMKQAMKEIDKIRKNLTDNPDVMDILKKANEDVSEGVGVDNRTLGFKAAMLRREKAKKVREKSKLKKEKKKEQAVLDARYDYDGEVDTILVNANKALFGETGANAVAHGGVDMAPNAGKKEKKSKVIKRYNY